MTENKFIEILRKKMTQIKLKADKLGTKLM